MKPIFTKKTYPNLLQKEKGGYISAVVEKMIVEYRFLGILLYRKELITPAFYGFEYWEEFTATV